MIFSAAQTAARCLELQSWYEAERQRRGQGTYRLLCHGWHGDQSKKVSEILIASFSACTQHLSCCIGSRHSCRRRCVQPAIAPCGLRRGMIEGSLIGSKQNSELPFSDGACSMFPSACRIASDILNSTIHVHNILHPAEAAEVRSLSLQSTDRRELCP